MYVNISLVIVIILRTVYDYYYGMSIPTNNNHDNTSERNIMDEDQFTIRKNLQVKRRESSLNQAKDYVYSMRLVSST